MIDVIRYMIISVLYSLFFVPSVIAKIRTLLRTIMASGNPIAKPQN